MIEIGVLAAFCAMIFWGVGDFFIQKTTRRLGDVEALFFIGVIGSVVLFPLVFRELPNIFSSSNISLALFLLGFSTLIVSIINFQALKEGKLAIVEPILELELPITMIFAFVLLQERLTLLQIFFSAVLFSGIMLISISKTKFKSSHFLEKGVLLAVATAFGFGFLNLFTGHVARTTSPLLAIWSAWTVFAMFCFIYLLYKKGLPRIISDAKKSRNIILAESIFDTFAWVFFAVAMVSLPISLATAIAESYPAVAVLLGIVINKELVKTHQFVGMGIALFSSVVLAFTI